MESISNQPMVHCRGCISPTAHVCRMQQSPIPLCTYFILVPQIFFYSCNKIQPLDSDESIKNEIVFDIFILYSFFVNAIFFLVMALMGNHAWLKIYAKPWSTPMQGMV